MWSTAAHSVLLLYRSSHVALFKYCRTDFGFDGTPPYTGWSVNVTLCFEYGFGDCILLHSQFMLEKCPESYNPDPSATAVSKATKKHSVALLH